MQRQGAQRERNIVKNATWDAERLDCPEFIQPSLQNIQSMETFVKANANAQSMYSYLMRLDQYVKEAVNKHDFVNYRVDHPINQSQKEISYHSPT